MPADDSAHDAHADNPRPALQAPRKLPPSQDRGLAPLREKKKK